MRNAVILAAAEKFLRHEGRRATALAFLVETGQQFLLTGQRRLIAKKLAHPVNCFKSKLELYLNEVGRDTQIYS
jgi:hypothetical protein